MKVCKICGSSYDDRVDFCFRDGSPLPKASAAPVIKPPPPPAPDAGVEAPPAGTDRGNPLPFGVMTSLPGPGRRNAPVVRKELGDLPAPGTTPEIDLTDPEVEVTADASELPGADLPASDMLTPAVDLDAADLPTSPMEQPHRPVEDEAPAQQAPAVEEAAAQAAPAVEDAPAQAESAPAVEQAPAQTAATPADEELEGPSEIAAPAVDLAVLSPPQPQPNLADTLPLPHPHRVEEPEDEPVAIAPPLPVEPPASNGGVVPPHMSEAAQQPLPTPPATPAKAAPAAAPAPEADDEPVAPPPSSRTGLFVGVIVALLAVSAGAFVALRPSPPPPEKPAVAATPKAETPAATPAPAAPAPTEPTAPTEDPAALAAGTPDAATVAPAATAPTAPITTSAPTSAAPATTAPTSAAAPSTTARTATPSAASADADNPWSSGASTTAAAPASGSSDDPWGTGGADAAVQTGTVSVVSVPAGAKVFVDDQARGQTPTKVELPQGLHTVRLELDGHQPAARSVNLSGDTANVSFELSPLAVVGQVNLFGPPGAEVYADGKALGKLPATGKLSEGSHTFKVVTPDGTEFTRTVQVQFAAPGQPAIISLAGP